jgi:hypothetical protein
MNKTTKSTILTKQGNITKPAILCSVCYNILTYRLYNDKNYYYGLGYFRCRLSCLTIINETFLGF